MEGIIRTPSSILRKRANKENESNREGKRPKLPSRRVSFAPDEELSTMHLYQKKDDSEDQVQVTEDLAAHMPYGAPNPLLPLQDTTNANAVNAHAAAAAAPAAALTPHNNQLIQLDGATGDLFSPLSMDLTNNSFELQRHQHQQLLPYPQRSPQIMPPPPPAPPAPPAFVPQPPMPSEYTRNITSAIPALSTLVEVR
ncbi:hypothetical protein DUNSADRAFT_5217 [Dunaliella salina]|uniref:Encoded protein n=1 Tax=Dunaliella salina TaxID=3046 RepID=A0ABQ7GQR5_DUNSA|nr:hypothetical protein DUNSADRAFT_5217 [Dunaliella salina]|eukprot:KAF5836940.1 hypothetical protein DUNSADRAFT_5217 [Dunaliella salina]